MVAYVRTHRNYIRTMVHNSLEHFMIFMTVTVIIKRVVIETTGVCDVKTLRLLGMTS